jgi:hypothetical protein
LSTSHTSKDPLTVEQLNAKKLNVSVDNFPPQDHYQNLPHYKALPDAGGNIVVWTPASGKKIHLVSFIISTPAAGTITLYDRTPPATDTPIMTLDFNIRNSVPFGLNTDLDFDYNHMLVAKWVQDAPGGGTAYITAIGHEHSPSDFS